MTFDEMTSCGPFKLILGSYAAPKTPEAKEHLGNYLQLMHRALSGMKLMTFEKVCDQVIKTMARGQKPMPEDFLNAQRALNEQYRTNPQKPDKCSSCDGTGWVQVNLMEIKTGTYDKFSKPCPLCRQYHSHQNAPLKDGWIEAETGVGPSLKPTPGMVNFLKANFDVDLDWSQPPEQILNDFMVVRQAFGMKMKKKADPFAKFLNAIKVKPSEPVREAAPLAAVGSPAPEKVVVNGEEYEVEE